MARTVAADAKLLDLFNSNGTAGPGIKGYHLCNSKKEEREKEVDAESKCREVAPWEADENYIFLLLPPSLKPLHLLTTFAALFV